MNRRRREILNLLFNLEGHITGSSLAANYGVSLSTIRSDIKELNNELAKYRVQVDSQIKKGYFLSAESKRLITQNNIIRTVIDKEYSNQMPLTPHERQMYLLLKLANNPVIDLEQLAGELFVSVSTLTNDINAARKWLKDNLGLSFRFSLVAGLSCNWSEPVIRNLIIWIMVENTNTSTISKYWHYLVNSDGSAIVKNNESLFAPINEISHQHGYALSGHSVVIIATAIGLFHERNRQGFLLGNCEDKREPSEVIRNLQARLEREHRLILPEADWALVEGYFMASQFLLETKLELFDLCQVEQTVGEFFVSVAKKYDLHLENVPGLGGDLKLYLVGLTNRARMHYPIANALDLDLKESHPLAHELAAVLEKIILERWGLALGTREMGYLTLHLAARQESWQTPIKAMIVCDYDQSVRNFIEYLIVAKTRNKIEIIKWHTYQEFILGELPELDATQLILSTATLKDKTDLPMVLIKPDKINIDLANTILNIDTLIDEIRHK